VLIGAHVSPAGGLVRAYERGVERGCDAIQIFNQNPRMWRPTQYGDDDVAAFGERLAAGAPDTVVIHAVYLINAANKDPEIREKSLTSMIHALQTGDRIGAAGVVLHPGSTVGEPKREAVQRIAEVVGHALSESERCPLLLEDTAGAGETLGRSFEELAGLLEAAGDGADDRLGVCLDCCHLLASGYDVRSVGGLTVANSGSVGLPFDGDPRASYLLIDRERVEVVRVEYDVEAEVAALRVSGYPDYERIAAMLRSGRFVAPA
jgi:deoxyribonuclease-4